MAGSSLPLDGFTQYHSQIYDDAEGQASSESSQPPPTSIGPFYTAQEFPVGVHTDGSTESDSDFAHSAPHSVDSESQLMRWRFLLKGISISLAATGLIVATFALWRSLASQYEIYCASDLAAWESRQDFMEFCASLDSIEQNPNCAVVQDATLSTSPLCHGDVKHLIHSIYLQVVEICANQANRAANTLSILAPVFAIIILITVVAALAWTWSKQAKDCLLSGIAVDHLPRTLTTILSWSPIVRIWLQRLQSADSDESYSESYSYMRYGEESSNTQVIDGQWDFQAEVDYDIPAEDEYDIHSHENTVDYKNQGEQIQEKQIEEEQTKEEQIKEERMFLTVPRSHRTRSVRTRSVSSRCGNRSEADCDRLSINKIDQVSKVASEDGTDDSSEYYGGRSLRASRGPESWIDYSATQGGGGQQDISSMFACTCGYYAPDYTILWKHLDENIADYGHGIA